MFFKLLTYFASQISMDFLRWFHHPKSVGFYRPSRWIFSPIFAMFCGEGINKDVPIFF
jgi:hypothetical protein